MKPSRRNFLKGMLAAPVAPVAIAAIGHDAEAKIEDEALTRVYAITGCEMSAMSGPVVEWSWKDE